MAFPGSRAARTVGTRKKKRARRVRIELSSWYLHDILSVLILRPRTVIEFPVFFKLTLADGACAIRFVVSQGVSSPGDSAAEPLYGYLPKDCTKSNVKGLSWSKRLNVKSQWQSLRHMQVLDHLQTVNHQAYGRPRVVSECLITSHFLISERHRATRSLTRLTVVASCGQRRPGL